MMKPPPPHCVAVPDHPVLHDAGNKARQDAVAALLDYCGSRHAIDKYLALGQATGEAICGESLWLPTRKRLEAFGVLSLKKKAKKGKHSNRYGVSFPEGNGWSLYEFQSKTGLRWFLARKETPGKDLDTEQSLDTQRVAEVAVFQVEHLPTVAVPPTEAQLGERLGQTPSPADRPLILAASGMFPSSLDSRGRLYTPFTQMRREDRRLFRFGGEDTSKVDVKNCFPLILAAEAAIEGYGDDFLKHSQSGDLYELIGAAVGIDDRECRRR